MIVSSVACALPASPLSNDDVVDLVVTNSRKGFIGDIEMMRSRLKARLERTGAKNRYWRAGEPILDLVDAAVRQALSEASLALTAIDLLIYASVDKSFIEPANACFIAKALGTPSVRTFDVTDACLGWFTATQVADGLMRLGVVEHALIVNVECPMDKGGSIYPSAFTVLHPSELAWKFSGLTFGEAVTATILSHDGRAPWRFFHTADAEKADLCTVPFGPWSRFSSSSRIGRDGPFTFSAYETDMLQGGFRRSVDVARASLAGAETEPFIVHSVSDALPRALSKVLKTQNPMVSLYPMTGNIASASIPAGLAHLKQRHGRLPKRAVGWVPSAGMKYAGFEIRCA